MEEKFLGRWKSGRVWKEPTLAKSSAKCKSRGVLNRTWEEKLQARKNLQQEKAWLATLKADKQAQKEAIKERRVANQARRKANEEKTRVTQVISNSRKIKAMSRKQRRQLAKQ